ncbi:hypothetical protein AMECASPLE_037310 [Ameca splendens]|uniref:Uncharacterized protein n=1 Tax=Ameca splendens TaxID=208324 RepID=A0ABV0YK07_9TELE
MKTYCQQFNIWAAETTLLSVILAKVYVPPLAVADTACDVISSVVAQLQTQHPNAFVAISGEFNHARVLLAKHLIVLVGMMLSTQKFIVGDTFSHGIDVLSMWLAQCISVCSIKATSQSFFSFLTIFS